MKNRFWVTIFSCALLLSLSAAPAQAGYVTIVNESKYCFYLWFQGYFLGYPTDMHTPCALPGKTEWTHTSLSVGKIKAFCFMKSQCGKGGIMVGEQYDVPGKWLPHRNFKVKISKDFKVTVTEEAP